MNHARLYLGYILAVLALLVIAFIFYIERDTIVIEPTNIFSYNQATNGKSVIRSIEFKNGLHNKIVADLMVERDTRFISDSWKDDTFIFIKNNTGSTSIFTLNIREANPTLQHLLTIPLSEDRESINDIKFLNNKELVYVSTKLRDHGDPNSEYNYYRIPGELGIVDIENSNKKVAYPLANTVKYGSTAAYSLLSKTADGKIFLQEGGFADGASSEYVWHTFDQKTEKVTLLNEKPPLVKRPTDGGTLYYFHSAKFNSDSTKIAYAGFENEIDRNDYGEGMCLKPETLGKYENSFGTLMLYDTTTGEKTELYRNTAHSDDLCKNWMRQVSSIVWVDDETLIFGTSDAIYKINIHTKALTPLYSYPLERNNNHIRIFDTHENYLLLNAYSWREDKKADGKVWRSYMAPNFIVVDMNNGKSKVYPQMAEYWFTIN